MTQQNAAMAEQATATTHSLAQESESLSRMIHQLQLGDGVVHAPGRRREGSGAASVRIAAADRKPRTDDGAGVSRLGARKFGIDRSAPGSDSLSDVIRKYRGGSPGKSPPAPKPVTASAAEDWSEF